MDKGLGNLSQFLVDEMIQQGTCLVGPKKLQNGLRLFRASVIVLPLIPMLILIIQSVFTVNDLMQRGKNLTKFENQVF